MPLSYLVLLGNFISLPCNVNDSKIHIVGSTQSTLNFMLNRKTERGVKIARSVFNITDPIPTLLFSLVHMWKLHVYK